MRIYIKDEIFNKLCMESQVDLLAVGIVGYEEETRKHFIIPESLDDSSISCAQRCSNNEFCDADDSIHSEIIAFLNEQTGCNFKVSTKKTRDLITGRLKEGYTVDDFKRVIVCKVKEWKADPRMSRYLKPSTLFAASNFEAYSNYAPPLNDTGEQAKQDSEGVKDYGVLVDW